MSIHMHDFKHRAQPKPQPLLARLIRTLRRRPQATAKHQPKEHVNV